MTWDVLMAYGWGTVASVVLVLVGTGLDIEAGRWWAERLGDADGLRLAREALTQVLETIDAVDALRRHVQARESAELLARLSR